MAKKSFWPYGIVLSIVAIILACAATIVVAINNPVEMDSAYMQSHQSVDENITFINFANSPTNKQRQQNIKRLMARKWACKRECWPKRGQVAATFKA